MASLDGLGASYVGDWSLYRRRDSFVGNVAFLAFGRFVGFRETL